MEASRLFPCWGKFERMGHDVTYGHFEVFDGTVLIARTPGLPASDDGHPEAPESVRLVQLGGPAFYGFTVLDETTVMARVESSRPWAPPLRRQLALNEESTDDPDSDPVSDDRGCAPIDDG